MENNYDIADADVKRFHRMWVIGRLCYFKAMSVQGWDFILACIILLRWLFGVGHWSDWIMLLIAIINIFTTQRLIGGMNNIFSKRIIREDASTALLLMTQYKDRFVRGGW